MTACLALQAPARLCNDEKLTRPSGPDQVQEVYPMGSLVYYGGSHPVNLTMGLRVWVRVAGLALHLVCWRKGGGLTLSLAVSPEYIKSDGFSLIARG